MPRIPGLVLVAGLISIGMGIMLMVVNGLVPGIVWLALPITVLGAGLTAIWIKNRRSERIASDNPPTTITNPIGLWFPVALFGIVIAQVIWAIYWFKNR